MDQKNSAPTGTKAVPQPRLLDRVRTAIRRRHYSYRTEQAYVHWIKRFIHFHGLRHPRDLGEPEVTAFLNSLVAGRGLAAATQNQALSSLLFLYKEVLERPLDWLDGLARSKRPARVPTVLTAAEVQRLLTGLEGGKWLMASLLYGAGSAAAGMPEAAGERRGLRLSPDHRARRQGWKRSRHDASHGGHRAVEGSSDPREGAA